MGEKVKTISHTSVLLTRFGTVNIRLHYESYSPQFGTE